MKQLYNARNQLFAELKYTKKIYTDYTKHSHCMLCFSFIESGSIEIEFNNEPILFKSNEIIIFNPRQIHCLTRVYNKTFGYYTLYIDEEWCLEIQNKIFHKKHNRLVPFSAMKLDTNDAIDFINLIHAIYKDKKLRTYEYDLENKLAQLFKKYCYTDSTLYQNDKKLINKIKKYILDNLDEEISLDDLSEYTNYSKNHIIKVFQNRYGLTPKKYIINQKINKAKNLIIQCEDSSLTDIAHRVGFYDQSHFNRHFKRIYGVNPSKYRN